MHAMGNYSGGINKYIELEEKYPMYQGRFCGITVIKHFIELLMMVAKYCHMVVTLQTDQVIIIAGKWFNIC